MKRKTVLITGGCGFIGSNLVDYLTRTGGYRIRVIDNLSLGSKESISEYDINFIEGDILDETSVNKALDNVDSVIHLAAHTRVIESIDDPTLNFNTNVIGTYKLLEACRENGINNIINASTGGAILGEAPPPINENMVARPMSPYGASKLAAEGYCSAFNHSYGMKASSLRFSNVYGPRSYHKGSVVAHFFKEIIKGNDLVVYGDGTQTRDFVFIDDLCKGIIQALKADKPDVYQLGSGKPTSINQLIDLIKDVIQDKYSFDVIYKEPRQGEIAHTWTDITKARKYLDYDASMELVNGLELTWQWFTKYYE
jgi:UDP-glucose 4-epimerase